MDYQTFNSQQHLPSSFGGPFSTASAAHLAPTTHSPQSQQLYADPQARLQQSSSPSPFPYAQQYTPNGQPSGYPPVGGVAANAMMQPGLSHNQNQLHQARVLQQQQQQQQHHQQQLQLQQQRQQYSQPQPSPSPYSTASYAQALASPAHQQFAQSRQTASPSSVSNSVPSNANSQQQPMGLSLPSSQLPTSQLQSQSQPMAQVQTPVKAKAEPPSPLSPVAQAREKDRMTTLLEINNLIIQEVVELQSQGRAGHIGPTPPEADKQQQPPAKEYVDCMRRLQSNLSFLAQNAEKHHKPNQAIQPGPAIMTVPASPPALAELYTKLQELYPGWRGQQAQMKASPGPQQRLGSTSQPPNSAGLQNNMNPPNSAGLQNNMQPLGNNGMQQNMQGMQNMHNIQLQSNMNNTIKQQQF